MAVLSMMVVDHHVEHHAIHRLARHAILQDLGQLLLAGQLFARGGGAASASAAPAASTIRRR
jgi:hypothetical protein